MSSPFLPRRDLIDCSPQTKRNASAMFDLPEPFGPTIPVMVDVKLRLAFFAKDLKPESSRDFISMGRSLFRSSAFGLATFNFARDGNIYILSLF
jgi:hypothetical protein